MTDRHGRRGHVRRKGKLATLSVAGGAAAGLAIERRYLRRVAGDGELAALSARGTGRPLRAQSADGTTLHAEVFGPDDGPTLVFAHGWTEQLSYWSSVIDALSGRGLRLVTYDLRGHGASGRAAGGDYQLARFGDDVEAVLAASVTDGSRAIVAGHSLGAMSIAAWAEQHDVAARVCAAALVNTGFGGLIAGNLLLPQLLRSLNERLARKVFLGSTLRVPSRSSPVQRSVIRYCAFGPTASLGQVAFYERMLVACPPDVRAACGLAMADMDLRPAVARLTVPTLVLAGDCDKLTPPSHSRRIAAALPDLALLIELPDTGHMSPLERPAELAAALVALVDSVLPRSDRAA